MAPAGASRSNRIGSRSPASETALCALPLSGRRIPESGRSGLKSANAAGDQVLECDVDADPLLIRLMRRRDVNPGGASRLVDPESQFRAHVIVAHGDDQLGRARPQAACEPLVLQDQLAARKPDMLQVAGVPPLVRGREELGKNAADAERIGSGAIGSLVEADAAVRVPDQRQTRRDRIDPPDREPSLEQHGRRAEADLDRRQLAEESAIVSAHAHADRTQVERAILAQT